MASYKAADNDPNVLADLKRQMAFFLHKHRQASEGNDSAGAAEAMRQITDLSSVIHDFEIRQQRLGRDLGDLVPRSELEHVARFIGLHLLRCADAAIASIAKVLTDRDPALPSPDAKEIRALIEPLLITNLVFQPIERAAAGTNSAAPPAWLVKALLEGRAEVVEE